MVTAAVRDNTFGKKRIIKQDKIVFSDFLRNKQTFQSVPKVRFGLEHRVAGAPGLEGPGLLQVLALEEELEAAGEGVEGLVSEHRCTVDVLLDAGVRGADLGDGQLGGGRS